MHRMQKWQVSLLSCLAIKAKQNFRNLPINQSIVYQSIYLKIAELIKLLIIYHLLMINMQQKIWKVQVCPPIVEWSCHFALTSPPHRTRQHPSCFESIVFVQTSGAPDEMKSLPDGELLTCQLQADWLTSFSTLPLSFVCVWRGSNQLPLNKAKATLSAAGALQRVWIYYPHPFSWLRGMRDGGAACPRCKLDCGSGKMADRCAAGQMNGWWRFCSSALLAYGK